MIRKFFKWFKLGFDRSFSSSGWSQLGWVVLLAIVLFIVGWAILFFFNDGIGGDSIWQSLRQSLGYLLNSDSYYYDVLTDKGMRVHPAFSIIFTFLGIVVMGGALVSVIVNMLTQRADDFRHGFTRYNLQGHIVVLGSGSMLINMIKYFREHHSEADIAVLTTTDIEKLRSRISAAFTRRDRKAITLMYGRRDSTEELSRINILSAKHVYLIGEENEPEHDIINIHTLELMRDLRVDSAEKESPIRCHILFEYQSAMQVIQFAEYKETLTKDAKSGQVLLELSVSNVYEEWAQNVFVSGKVGNINYQPLDREPIGKDSDKFVHLVVVGMTRMGVAMIETAAHLCHFPNIHKGKKTRITIIDPNARQEMRFFTEAHEHLFHLSHYTFGKVANGTIDYHPHQPESVNDILDIDWEFIEGSIEMPEIRSLLAHWSGESEQRLLTIAFCGRNAQANVASALYLPQAIYVAKIPILVYQPGDSTLVEITSKSNGEKYAALRPFGMVSGTFNPGTSEDRLDIARKINYCYDYFGRKDKQTKYAETFPPKEELEKVWNETILPHQFSNLYLANGIDSKYRSMGASPQTQFADDETSLMAEIEHNRWMMEKLLLGYRPTTEEETMEIERSNPEKKLKSKYKETRFAHYDIRPFADLRKDEKGIVASDYDICMIRAMELIKRDQAKDTQQ
ncbi:MAG: hypothetical protein LBN06_02670 [Prevotellaceae bacterium]|jgi:hypothetical protein|nr:hypothetical protein [Prevotellaceae bacterium]